MPAANTFTAEALTEAYAMADGSLLLVNRARRQAHALNSEAAEVWTARQTWTVPELARWLVQRGNAPDAAEALAGRFLTELVQAGLLRSGDGPSR